MFDSTTNIVESVQADSLSVATGDISETVCPGTWREKIVKIAHSNSLNNISKSVASC